MALRTIAHALFTWTEGGEARLAMHGQTVEIADDVIAANERHGVFEAVVHDAPPVAADEAPADPPAPADPRQDLVPPRPASNKAAWAEYATALGIAVAGLDKDEIIAAVAAADEGNDR